MGGVGALVGRERESSKAPPTIFTPAPAAPAASGLSICEPTAPAPKPVIPFLIISLLSGYAVCSP